MVDLVATIATRVVSCQWDLATELLAGCTPSIPAAGIVGLFPADKEGQVMRVEQPAGLWVAVVLAVAVGAQGDEVGGVVERVEGQHAGIVVGCELQPSAVEMAGNVCGHTPPSMHASAQYGTPAAHWAGRRTTSSSTRHVP